MKTTIDIATSVLNEARKLASREGVTLKVLVETGLRRIIAEKKGAVKFQLRDAAFEGKGLQSGAQDLDWDRLREMSYEGRGSDRG